MKIKTGNSNPNFTIILPGTCQAKCDFCFWKEEKNTENFTKSLKRVLKNLPDFFTQISISGGEPTLSPVFEKSLKIINKFKNKGKINKVVLTTNGIFLEKFNLSGIDHINISRHSVNDIINEEIFNTTKIPNTLNLSSITEHCNKFGIDVNYNCVLTDVMNDDINHWTHFVKSTGATSITFRNQYGIYGKSKVEKELIDEGYIPKTEQSCPVCKTVIYIKDGVKIKFHSSDYEPTESEAFDDDEVYELILQQTGVLTRDWEAKKIIDM